MAPHAWLLRSREHIVKRAEAGSRPPTTVLFVHHWDDLARMAATDQLGAHVRVRTAAGSDLEEEFAPHVA